MALFNKYPEARPEKKNFFFSGKPRKMREVLFFLLYSITIPLFVIQLLIYVLWFRTDLKNINHENLHITRAIGLSLSSYIHSIERQELTLIKSLGLPGTFDRRSAESLFRDAVRIYPSILRVSLVNPGGIIVASSDPTAIGVDHRAYGFYPRMMNGESFVVDNLIQSQVDRKLVFLIASAIRGTAGSLSGILVATVDPDTMGKDLLDISLREERIITVFDGSGTLVCVQPAVPQTLEQRKKWISQDPVLRKAISTKKESTGSLISPLDGSLRRAARVPVPDIGWFTGSGEPWSTIIGQIIRGISISFGLTLLVLFVSIMAALMFVRRILGTLKSLESQAVAIGNGGPGGRPAGSGIVEFDELAGSIDRMDLQLQERGGEIEKKTKDLERSNKNLEEFAYVASHDLQEPLRMMASYSELLGRRYSDKIDKDAHEFIGYIVEGARRMQTLINDLLMYSRIGRTGLSRERFDANGVMKDVLENLAPALKTGEAVVTFDPLPQLTGNRSNFIQLFQNLVGNAVKFRGQEPPRVHVGVVRRDEDWLFSVRDNGIGIDPQFHDKVFKIFQRLHTREKYPGTGIGLSICKMIVESSGGRIWIESGAGKGSVFYFTIPVKGDE